MPQTRELWTGAGCPECAKRSVAPTDLKFDDYFHGRWWTCPYCALSMSLHALIDTSLRTQTAVALSVARTDDPAGSVATVTDGAAEAATMAHGLGIAFHPNDDPELTSLVTAIEAFSEKNYRGVILPACVAVEGKLLRVLRVHYERFSSADTVRLFLQDEAKFEAQLSLLLPSLMASVGAPVLPPVVSTQISTMRRLGNTLADRDTVISRDDAIDAVLGSMFGYRYLALYGTLLSRPADGGNTACF